MSYYEPINGLVGLEDQRSGHSQTGFIIYVFPSPTTLTILSFTLCVRLNCNIHLMVFVVEFEYSSPDFMYKPSRDFAYLCCV